MVKSDNLIDRLSEINSQIISEKEQLKIHLKELDIVIGILSEKMYWMVNKDLLFKDFIFLLKDFYADIYEYIDSIELEASILDNQITTLKNLPYASYQINLLLNVIWKHGKFKSSYSKFPVLKKVYVLLNELNIDVQYLNNISYRLEYILTRQLVPSNAELRICKLQLLKNSSNNSTPLLNKRIVYPIKWLNVMLSIKIF